MHTERLLMVKQPEVCAAVGSQTVLVTPPLTAVLESVAPRTFSVHGRWT